MFILSNYFSLHRTKTNPTDLDSTVVYKTIQNSKLLSEQIALAS